MKKFRRIVVAAVGFILLFAITFYFWGSSGWVDEQDRNKIITYSEAALPADTLTVMTYNLGYLSGMTNNLPLERPVQLFDSNSTRAMGVLRNNSPDIIGFQEIDFDSDRSMNGNQLDTLGINLGYHQAYASVNWDKRYVPFPYLPVNLHFGKMNSGQAILSKYPLGNAETIVLQKPINAPFYYNAFYLDRLVQLVDVQIRARKIKVMNVHLEAFDSETREKQAYVVRDLFEKFANEMPVLLIGDFNSEAPWVEGSDEVMKTILSAANIASAIGIEQYDLDTNSSYTFSSGDPQKMIDYILYNDNFIEKIDSRVVNEAGDISDHLPMMMTFTFKSSNGSDNSE